jgi:ferredoxin-NADP reductase
MISQDTVVLWNRPAAPDYYRMGLSCPVGFDTAKPGQFIMVRTGTN